MRAALVLAAVLAAAAARAGDVDAAREIRSGRAALEASDPTAARGYFAAALAATAAAREDRFAAAVGLGRAENWLGHYRAAANAFERALGLAGSPDDRRVARTGLAQALNALEYYDRAYRLAAPLAAAGADACVEALRAAIALGRADQAPPIVAACPPAESSSRAGAELRRLRDDVALRTSSRLQVDASFSHDSDGLDLRRYALGAQLPGRPGGESFAAWRVAAATTAIADPQRSLSLQEGSVGADARLGESQQARLLLGAASADGWTFVQGAAAWDARLGDRASVGASVERAPILTTAAIADRILYDTYSADASLRAADHWYVVPAYFHQDFSDGNHRDGGVLKVLLSPYDLPHSASAIGADAYVRAFDASRPTRGVYFSPGRYRQTRLDLIAVHSFSRDWRLRLVAGAGSERIDGAGRHSYAWNLSLTGRLAHGGRLELRLGRDTLATLAGGGSGYWNDSAEATIVFPL